MKINYTLIITLVITSLFLSGFKNAEKEEHIKIDENDITSQPYKVELIDDKTPQTQNSLSLKIANDVNLHKIKVGEKFLLTLPSNINLVDGTIMPAGTKFSATVIKKEHTKIGIKFKIIINEIIFTDTNNYIILSNPKNIKPLKTISVERILGKHAKVNGIFKLGTEISSVNISQNRVHLEPETTTAVGIGIIIKTGVRTIKAGTPVTIQFNDNIKPQVEIL